MRVICRAPCPAGGGITLCVVADEHTGAVDAELGALRARTAAMQTEIDELHRQLDALRGRERALMQALEAAPKAPAAADADADAQARARAIVQEAEQRAAALRTEGLLQVRELQQQCEQLLALRAGLSAALRQATADIAGVLDRVAAAPARAVEQVPPLEPLSHRPASELDAWLARQGWPTS